MKPSVSLSTLAAAKSYIGVNNTDDDTLITDLIEMASGWIEMFCGRKFKTGTAIDDIFDVELGQTRFYVTQYPVTTITQVRNSITWDYDNAGDIDATLYTTDANGLFLFQRGELLAGDRALRIRYNGGLVADTAAVESTHPTLAIACRQIVSGAYKRRNQLDSETSAFVGATKTMPALRVPAITKHLLLPYRSVAAW